MRSEMTREAAGQGLVGMAALEAVRLLLIGSVLAQAGPCKAYYLDQEGGMCVGRE